MTLFRVEFDVKDIKQKQRKLLVADSAKELLDKGVKKFGIENEEIDMLLEDGTIINDDEKDIFDMIPNNTLVIFKRNKDIQQEMEKQVAKESKTESKQLTIVSKDGGLSIGPAVEKEEQETAPIANITINQNDLQSRSVIFNPATRPLKKYEIAINEASRELCTKDGSLLLNRQLLLDKARAVVNESGYAYKKKYSRSKVFGQNEHKDKSKRKYLSAEIRLSRLAQLNSQIKSLDDTISLLEKQKVQFINASKFLQAAEVNTMISEKNKAKSQVKEDIAKLNAASAQAVRHQKRKAAKFEIEIAKKRAKYFFPNVQDDGISASKETPCDDDVQVIEKKDETAKCDNIADEEPSSVSSEKPEENVSFTSNFEENLLYERYLSHKMTKLSEDYKVNSDIYMSKVDDLTLSEFLIARDLFCHATHKGYLCETCQTLISMGKELIYKGILPLSVLYRQYCNAGYKAGKATRFVMQLPVVVFRYNNQLFVTELNRTVDMSKFIKFASDLIAPNNVNGISKESLKLMLELASGEKDRRLIRVAAASHMSGRTASKELGISNLNDEKEKVNIAIRQLEEIKAAVNDIVESRESASSSALETLAESESSTSDDDDYDEELPKNIAEELAFSSRIGCDGFSSLNDYKGINEEFDHFDGDCSESKTNNLPSDDALLRILEENQFNWIAFMEDLRVKLSLPQEIVDDKLKNFYELQIADVDQGRVELVKESMHAYLIQKEESNVRRKATDFETVVTDSESDDPEDWLHIKDSNHTNDLKTKLKKQRAVYARMKKRLVAKHVVERRLLKRSIPPKVSRTLKKYPNIGKDIEKYARECRIGADSWRRTGLLTFSGNSKTGPKLTYMRIKKFLESKYKTSFGYGTIVQLCHCKNKRHLSSKRYWNAAQVMSRRARKGFNIKLNVDAHWSCRFYKGLDHLQLRDGSQKFTINRDDAAGFRLDTTFTHKQHKLICNSDSPELTTRSDYVNKYSSILQTTSYLLMGTENTEEVAIGVVKANGVYQKNAGQHAADYVKVKDSPEFSQYFEKKPVQCVRVDGAGDENPGFDEVQFHWSERHFEEGRTCTLVTCRHSGGSYLNRVELLNGCLALGHSGIFIPSTINGSNTDRNTGKISQEQLDANLKSAMSVYINRVSGTTFSGKAINLIEGSTSALAEKYQERRSRLKVFLKGPEYKRREMKQLYPEDFEYFDKVWAMRTRHMVKNLPKQYIFMLLPCYESHCPHPVCQMGRMNAKCLWYPLGPTIDVFPLPVKDPLKPWGTKDCAECSQYNRVICTGHYLSIESVLEMLKRGEKVSYCRPPKDVIKDSVIQNFATNSSLSEEEISNLAKECLLPISDVEMLVDHLYQIEKRRKDSSKKRENSKKNNNEKGGTAAVRPLKLINESHKDVSRNVQNFQACCSENKVAFSSASPSKLNTEQETGLLETDAEVFEDDDDDLMLHCICSICKEPWNGFMIQCEQCAFWFHGDCVNITPKRADQLKYYYCPDCKERKAARRRK